MGRRKRPGLLAPLDDLDRHSAISMVMFCCPWLSTHSNEVLALRE